MIERLPGGGEIPFKIRYMGNYMVIEIFNGGVIVIWDKKTSVFIKLSTDFKVRCECKIETEEFYSFLKNCTEKLLENERYIYNIPLLQSMKNNV